MAHNSRVERRQARRRIKAAGQAVMRAGLALDEDHSSVVALAYILRSRLLERDKPGAAVEVARIAAEIFEKTVKKNPPVEPLDCKIGCSYCCSRMVGVSAPEAFWVAEQISKSGEGTILRDGFLERAKDTIGADMNARRDKRTFCALLDDGACGIYGARPLACRANASHSVKACIAAFQGEAPNIPASMVHMFLGDRCRFAIYAALRSLGLPAVSYELSEAVCLILREENASERWRAGEDIFAEVQAPADRTRDIDAFITRMSRAITF